METDARKSGGRRISDRMLTAITAAQSAYVAQSTLDGVFEGLLNALLELTGSEYGFIGEVLRTADGKPYLKTHAITDISWNAEMREFYEKNAPSGLEFYNLDTLFGHVMTSAAPVIANEPATDPRAAGIPEGHPPLNTFMGLPFFSGRDLVGMIGIANHSGGYDEAMVSTLGPFLATCGNIIGAARSDRAKGRVEEELRASEAQANAIIEAASDGFLMLDSSGKVLRANASAERMYARDNLVGAPLDTLLDAETLERVVESGADQRPFTIEGKGSKRDGRAFDLELSLSWSRLQTEPVMVAMVRDITTRKELDRAKDQFVSTVSHELRTPLTSLRGSLGLLGGGAVDLASPAATEMLDLALRSSDRLIALVNDILDFEKLHVSGLVMPTAPCSPLSIIQQAVTTLLPLANDKSVRLEYDASGAPESIEGAEERLVQVLENLIGNAVKFSDDGGVVRVTAEARDGGVRFEVGDEGCGIPASRQGSIFEPFHQLDSSKTRQHPGSGLGLAIVRGIVERHGGHVGVESKPGQGSTFWFDLPSPA